MWLDSSTADPCVHLDITVVAVYWYVDDLILIAKTHNCMGWNSHLYAGTRMWLDSITADPCVHLDRRFNNYCCSVPYVDDLILIAKTHKGTKKLLSDLFKINDVRNLPVWNMMKKTVLHQKQNIHNNYGLTEADPG